MNQTITICTVLLASTLAVDAFQGFSPRTALGSDYQVRLGYVVPQNRTPQPNALGDVQRFMQVVQDWYAEQMDRNGFGPKTFELEMVSGTPTPAVHLIHASVTDEYIRESVWGHTMDSANANGFSMWTPGQIWFLVPESHVQEPDGALVGGIAGGAHVSSGGGSGVAMVGSDMLPRITPTALVDDRPYEGLIIPELGPLPLVQSVSFPWFEGTTYSSASSSAQGAVAHELGHAFGLAHDNRNDANFHGNLMFNGLRGMRGSLLPAAYPDDDMRLSYAAALRLNSSRYFNPDTIYHELVQPNLQILTSGEVDPVDGLLEINFTASDDSGLAVALLRRGGDTVAEMPLSGTSVNETFAIPLYGPGTAETFTVEIIDTQGNTRSVEESITPSTGFNQAPKPYLSLSDSRIHAGREVLLDVSNSTDDDGLSGVMVAWDLNADGIFEIPGSLNRTLTVSFDQPGTRLVQARLTDLNGAHSVSTPLSLRILPAGDFDVDLNVDGADFLAWQRGESPSASSESDLTAWEESYGTGTPLAPTSSSIPEPSTLLLAVAAALLSLSKNPKASLLRPLR